MTATQPDPNDPFSGETPPLANYDFGEDAPTIGTAAGTICLFVPVCGEVEVAVDIGIGIYVASKIGIAIHEGTGNGTIPIPTIHLSKKRDTNQANAAWREIQRICRSRGVELNEGHRRRWHDKEVTGRGLDNFDALVQAGVDAFCPAE